MFLPKKSFPVTVNLLVIACCVLFTLSSLSVMAHSGGEVISKKPQRLSRLMECWMRRSGTQHFKNRPPCKILSQTPAILNTSKISIKLFPAAVQVATQTMVDSVSVVANSMAMMIWGRIKQAQK